MHYSTILMAFACIVLGIQARVVKRAFVPGYAGLPWAQNAPDSPSHATGPSVYLTLTGSNNPSIDGQRIRTKVNNYAFASGVVALTWGPDPDPTLTTVLSFTQLTSNNASLPLNSIVNFIPGYPTTPPFVGLYQGQVLGYGPGMAATQFQFGAPSLCAASGQYLLIGGQSKWFACSSGPIAGWKSVQWSPSDTTGCVPVNIQWSLTN